MANRVQMDMQLNTYRGYSAYELAVKNGFAGTLEEWLQSLRGTDGRTTSVNGVQQEEGNITLTGADIPVSATDSRTLSDLAAAIDRITSTMTFTDEYLDLGGRYLENARFR